MLKNNSKIPANNNLEWLRLAFALQVVLSHSAIHLELNIPNFIAHFPGVPAFFFVSGLLIYTSYANAPGRDYFRNRFLRIFPALLVVTIGSLFIILIDKGFQDFFINFKIYFIWLLSQITIGQAYNPTHFRDMGVGVINGSLWTITTEILFYTLVPALYFLDRRFKYTISVFFILSFIFYAFAPDLLNSNFYRNKTLYDAFALTPIAWGWMFAFGMILAKNYDALRKWTPHSPWAILPMVCMIMWGEGIFFGSAGNRLGLFYFLTYAILISYIAFNIPPRPLKFDISYGIYVWHMPIINLFLILSILNLWLVIFITITMGFGSWYLIEKPALRLKKRTLKNFESDRT